MCPPSYRFPPALAWVPPWSAMMPTEVASGGEGSHRLPQGSGIADQGGAQRAHSPPLPCLRAEPLRSVRLGSRVGSLRSPRVRPRRTRRAPAIAAAPRRTIGGLDTPRWAATRDYDINSHSIPCTLQAAHNDRSKVGNAARKSAKNCEPHRILTLALSSCFSAPAKQFQTP